MKQATKLWCLQKLQSAVLVTINTCTVVVRVCNRLVSAAQRLDVWIDGKLLEVRFGKKPLSNADDIQ